MPRGEVVVDGLTWRPVGRRRPVLEDFSLRIPAGQRVLIAGPSGSGKSTLLRALAGLLLTADAGDLAGSVLIDGVAPGDQPGQVGLVLQEPGAGVVAASVGRDVAFGLENVRMPREQMPPIVATALEDVALELPLDTPTGSLSGGQTQRLAIAGALALEPAVLLLDEPTAMLDPTNAAAVREVVARVVGEHRLTLVVVEHRIDPWLDLVDRLVVLDGGGQIVADGAPDAVLASSGQQLADLGIWVPGLPAPTPDPVVLPGAPVVAPIQATSLRIDRTRRLADGTPRTVVAAELAKPLTPQPGSHTALVGPSGSGKSTILLTLAGLLRPSAGAVTAGSGHPLADLRSAEVGREVAWVPQWSSSALVGQTVREELLVTPRSLGRPAAETEATADELLAALHLTHLAAADPRVLSGGEQRRLAVAAGVAHGPATLLADEPTVGLDRHTWAAVVGVLDAYRRAGGAVVVSTHDDELVRRSDDVVSVVAPEVAPAPADTRRPSAARLNPLAALVITLLAIPAGVVSTNWRHSLVVLAAQVLLAAVALLAPGEGPAPRGRLRRLLVRCLPSAFAALSVGWSTWWLAGHNLDSALTVAMRVVLIAFPSAVLIPYLDPDRLGDYLAQRLGLPDRPVVAVAAALQRVHSFGDIWREISGVRRVRGIGPTWRSPRSIAAYLGAATMGLLVRSLHAAAELALAMDARGFATAYDRSWFAPAPWRWLDSLGVLLGLVPLVVAVSL